MEKIIVDVKKFLEKLECNVDGVDVKKLEKEFNNYPNILRFIEHLQDKRQQGYIIRGNKKDRWHIAFGGISLLKDLREQEYKEIEVETNKNQKKFNELLIMATIIIAFGVILENVEHILNENLSYWFRLGIGFIILIIGFILFYDVVVDIIIKKIGGIKNASILLVIFVLLSGIIFLVKQGYMLTNG